MSERLALARSWQGGGLGPREEVILPTDCQDFSPRRISTTFGTEPVGPQSFGPVKQRTVDTSTFWGGVLVGLVVAAIIAFSKRTWQSWLGPTLRATFARGSADVSGDYTGEYWELGDEDYDMQPHDAHPVDRGADGTETIQLQQRGRHIKGRIVREISGVPDRVSTFTGQSADRHINGTYDSTDPKNPERGSFCLKISNGGSTLRGGYLWYNTKEGKETIDYGRYVWKRKK